MFQTYLLFQVKKLLQRDFSNYKLIYGGNSQQT